MQSNPGEVNKGLDIHLWLAETVARFGERQQRVGVVIRLQPIREAAEINIALAFDLVPGVTQCAAKENASC